MMFTLCLLLLLATWVVALGRQAVPPGARVPLRRSTAADLARDAARGARELGSSAERRPATVPVVGHRAPDGDVRRPAAHL